MDMQGCERTKGRKDGNFVQFCNGCDSARTGRHPMEPRGPKRAASACATAWPSTGHRPGAAQRCGPVPVHGPAEGRNLHGRCQPEHCGRPDSACALSARTGAASAGALQSAKADCDATVSVGQFFLLCFGHSLLANDAIIKIYMSKCSLKYRELNGIKCARI